MSDTRLGDRMPDRRAVKFGDMKAGTPRMSDEWTPMESGDARMSEKWVGQSPSSARMSEKWVEMEAGEPKGNEWHEMRQDKRMDPYSMAPQETDDKTPFKSMEKSKVDAGKVRRSTQHDEHGQTREI